MLIVVQILILMLMIMLMLILMLILMILLMLMLMLILILILLLALGGRSPGHEIFEDIDGVHDGVFHNGTVHQVLQLRKSQFTGDEIERTFGELIKYRVRTTSSFNDLAVHVQLHDVWVACLVCRQHRPSHRAVLLFHLHPCHAIGGPRSEEY